jgi:hypothetical protein
MAKDFKQMVAAQRSAVPQIDLEQSPSRGPGTPPQALPGPLVSPPIAEPVPAAVAETPQSSVPTVNLTPVDTSERPVSHGFQMYPSRHRQLARDLAFIEERHPWEIVDDALEEYVVRHYGKEHKRR